MKLRIQGNQISDTVVDAVGSITNKGLFRPRDVIYVEQEKFVMFRFQRFPIIGKGLFSDARQADHSVPSTLTIRNVLSCKIENTGQCNEISILFGMKIKDNEVFLSSAEESHGITCYSLHCEILAVDVEIADESIR